MTDPIDPDAVCIQDGDTWWWVSEWNPDTETGDELVGPFATHAECWANYLKMHA